MCLKLAWAQKAVYKNKIAKHKKMNITYILYVYVLLFMGYQKDKNVHVFAVTFAFHFADIVVYSGQFPLFVPVSDTTSFLYRRCEAVSRR